MKKLALAAALLLYFVASTPAFAQLSMFADPKAMNEGDLLTVVLVERTTAHRESAWSNDSDAALSGGADVDGGNLAGRFALDAAFNKEARNRNRSSQRDLLNGTVTTRVVDVDSTGNLVIEGERKLSVNGETHLLRIAGVVRPLDVRSNNTVLSPDIADAEIEYRRGGIHRRFLSPAAFVKAGVLAVLGAAIVFGAN